MVHHCIRQQCFILLPNDGVVFKICFAILHNIVARNNVQTILTSKRGKKLRFTHWHYIWVVMLHIQVICFECMAAWKRCCDMRQVCGNIFEDCNVRQKLNVTRCLVETYGYMMIFILVHAQSFKNIRMLAYRARFCYAVNLKFRCFRNLFSPISYNMGTCWNHNVWQNGYKRYILIIIFRFFACT